MLRLQVAKEYMSTMGTPVVRARLEAGKRPSSLSGELPGAADLSCNGIMLCKRLWHRLKSDTEG